MLLGTIVCFLHWKRLKFDDSWNFPQSCVPLPHKYYYSVNIQFGFDSWKMSPQVQRVPTSILPPPPPLKHTHTQTARGILKSPCQTCSGVDVWQGRISIKQIYEDVSGSGFKPFKQLLIKLSRDTFIFLWQKEKEFITFFCCCTAADASLLQPFQVHDWIPEEGSNEGVTSEKETGFVLTWQVQISSTGKRLRHEGAGDGAQPLGPWATCGTRLITISVYGRGWLFMCSVNIKYYLNDIYVKTSEDDVLMGWFILEDVWITTNSSNGSLKQCNINNSWEESIS